jgi:hypothetical protein
MVPKYAQQTNRALQRPDYCVKRLQSVTIQKKPGHELIILFLENNWKIFNSVFRRSMSTAPPPVKTLKRDALKSIEQSLQSTWATLKVHERDATPGVPKYLATFPYPYMNGRLHLGHSFSMSKVEFAVGFERLRGKNALFPFGFHCTGTIFPLKPKECRLRRVQTS